MRVYDILVCKPFTFRLKVAYRNLFGVEPKLGWDDPVPSNHRNVWISLMNMMISARGVSFRRATRPPGAVGKSQLVCFFDGSDDGFATGECDGQVSLSWVQSSGPLGPRRWVVPLVGYWSYLSLTSLSCVFLD